jgi:hypothetical protein
MFALDTSVTFELSDCGMGRALAKPIAADPAKNRDGFREGLNPSYALKNQFALPIGLTHK